MCRGVLIISIIQFCLLITVDRVFFSLFLCYGCLVILFVKHLMDSFILFSYSAAYYVVHSGFFWVLLGSVCHVICMKYSYWHYSPRMLCSDGLLQYFSKRCQAQLWDRHFLTVLVSGCFAVLQTSTG